MLKERRKNIALIGERKSEIDTVKGFLSHKYSYQETIEEGRIVLKTERNIKLVEVIDTLDDREKYKQVMYDYLYYVQDNYRQSFDFDKVDYDAVFENDNLTDKKHALPMFFAYNANGKLLGVLGYKKPIVVKYNNKNTLFQELSIRFASVKKESYTIGKDGVEAFFVAYLFALNRRERIVSATYLQLRMLMFNLQKILKHRYVGVVIEQEPFATKPLKVDVFVNGVANNEYNDNFKQALIDAVSKR